LTDSPSSPGATPGPEPAAPAAPDSAPAAPDSSPGLVPFGLTRFSIEGRRAPGLFVVGWLSTLVGAGILLLAALGATGSVAPILAVVGLVPLALGLVLLGGSETVERRAIGASYAGPSPLLVLVTVVVVSRLAGFVIGAPLAAIGLSVPRPVADLLAVIVQAVVFVGVVRLLVVGAGALSWRDMGVVGPAVNALRGILGGAVFAGPIILVTAIVALAAVGLAGVTPPSPLPPTGTASGLVLHLLAGAVIAPVAEEVLFRGFALTAWRRTVGVRAAIIRSSIVFVLAHVVFVSGDTFREAASIAFVAGVVRVPIALALGWLFVRTGSLWGPIGLHAAFNGILITLGETAAPT
jgi:membrane protease YdiL (CAAX protease family)